ncbi:MAG: hypothetical protein K2X47_01810, partial [Bdellovibrionales bacterium]|nr:hypothetical protein [Bdellovibrionales bacterium]
KGAPQFFRAIRSGPIWERLKVAFDLRQIMRARDDQNRGLYTYAYRADYNRRDGRIDALIRARELFPSADNVATEELNEIARLVAESIEKGNDPRAGEFQLWLNQKGIYSAQEAQAACELHDFQKFRRSLEKARFEGDGWRVMSCALKRAGLTVDQASPIDLNYWNLLVQNPNIYSWHLISALSDKVRVPSLSPEVILSATEILLRHRSDITVKGPSEFRASHLLNFLFAVAEYYPSVIRKVRELRPDVDLHLAKDFTPGDRPSDPQNMLKLTDILLRYGHLVELKLNIQMSYQKNSPWTQDRWAYHFFETVCSEWKKQNAESEKTAALLDLLANVIPPTVCPPANRYYSTFLNAGIRCEAPLEVLKSLVETKGCPADQTIYYDSSKPHPSQEWGALASHLKSDRRKDSRWIEVADLLIQNSEPLRSGKVYCVQEHALDYLRRRGDLIIGQPEEWRSYGSPTLQCLSLTKVR